MSHDEDAILDLLLKFLICIYVYDVSLTVIVRFLEDIRLDFLQQILHVFLNAITSDRFLLQSITAHHLDCIIFQITTTHSQTHGNTFQLVLSELPARLLIISVVIFHGDTQRLQLSHDTSDLLADLR